MTQRQRELMQQLSSLADLPSGRETLYIYNSNAAEEPAGEPAGTPAHEAAALPAQMPADTNECLVQGAESIYEALIGMPELRNAGAEVSSIAQIVPSKRSQQERLEAWGRLMERHRQTLAERLPKAAESAGFAGNAFSNFFSVIENYVVKCVIILSHELILGISSDTLYRTEGYTVGNEIDVFIRQIFGCTFLTFF